MPEGIVLPALSRRPFEDLRISSRVLEDRCYVVEGAVLRVYFQLSPIPPLGWSFLFSSTWQAVRDADVDKPHAGIEYDAIWIECIPEQIQEYHLPALENAVAQTNASYRDSLRQKAGAQQTLKQLDNHSRLKVQQLQNSLNPEDRLVTPEKNKIGVGWMSSLRATVRSIFKRR